MPRWVGPPIGYDEKLRSGATSKEKLDLVKNTNLLVVGGDKSNLQKFNAVDLEVKNPASRQAYEDIRTGFLDQIGKASYFSQETDTANAREQLEFKAGLRVSGGFGSVNCRHTGPLDGSTPYIWLR